LRVCREAKERFEQQTTAQEQEQYELVVLDKKKAVDEYVESMHLNPARKRRQRLNQQAMAQGYATAGKVLLNRPIDNSNPVGSTGN